jgi:DNA-binding transcriptional LysR family regulator
VEAAVNALQQRVADAHREISGVVRVTCPEPIVLRIAGSDFLDRFHERYPAVKVDFVMSDRYLDLTRGEADVALRSGDTVDNELIGRKIGDSLWAVYASRKYLERHPPPQRAEDLANHALVGFDEGMSQHRAAQWLATVAPNAHVGARNDSVLGLVYSAKAGLGLAALPTALGDAEPDLLRVLGPIPELTRIWRVLTTHELRHTPRVSAFFEFVADQAQALRPILTG